MSTSQTGTFGLIGLGVMGRALAQNLHDHGERVVAWDREPEVRAREEGGPIQAVDDLAALCAHLERPRRILVMVTAGAPVDAVLEALAPNLEEGDIVIDGGNSRFEDTDRREAAMRERGLNFVGMGVSGGEEGARRGPSMMPGGSTEAWDSLRPALEAIAARTESGPCVTHVGPGGAGHFVKIVHNGIEYADMQLLAEAYDVLARAGNCGAPELARIFAGWNEGPLESFLVEITARIFEVEDPQAGGPLVERILDQAGQKGTGRWTMEAALEHGVSVPTISAALDARVQSSQRARRLALAERRLESSTTVEPADVAGLARSLEQALLVARICAYAQGFELLQAASEERGWGLRMGELARIWKGGCIIRARLLDDVMRAYADAPDLAGLLFDGELARCVREGTAELRHAVALAQARGIPVPALSSSLAWLDAVQSPRLPQNLTQAQRDAFGAHGYQRLDDPEGSKHHSQWW